MQSCNKQWTFLPCDMLRYLKRWTAEWEADLEARPEEVKDSSSGYTATIQFQQTMSFFKPLFKQLKRRQVDCVSSVACFWQLQLAPTQGLRGQPQNAHKPVFTTARVQEVFVGPD